MSCESIRKSLPLYLYGELPPEEEERVEDHLDGCPECRSELDRQRAMLSALGEREIQPSEALLDECRHNLMSEIHRQQSAPARARTSSSPWMMIRDGLSALLAPVSWMRQPVGAVALIALGYFSARFVNMTPTSISPASLAPESMISSIRSVQPEPSGRVRIALDETRRRVVSGALDDANIQRLLLAAVRDETNPAVRVESVGILTGHPGSPEIRDALLYAVKHDPNPGVRLKALDGLKDYASDADLRRTLSEVLLKDDNPGVRIRAIDMLVAHRDDSMVGVLQNLVDKDKNNYVRLRCEKALRDMNASVGTF